MKDKADRHENEKDFNFLAEIPPLHAFMKNFSDMRCFPRKGAFFKPFGHHHWSGHRVPITKVTRNDEGYNILMELPGISKEDINLEATNDELWFSATNKELKKEFHHHIHFRRPIRPVEIKANLKRGILTITAPYSERIPKTKVNIE
ncbi:MAG: Hsp20/alpha crystallin family protein [Candidatus Hodarchaeales archaeon]|jgi:HSP20 family molecular chaperone IbpA